MNTTFDRVMHQKYLISLLSGITKVISEKIAFKGGTCAMLFYDLPRFSFDLDFDILQPLLRSDIDLLKEVLSNQGNILDEKDKEYTYFLLFSYTKGYHKIKIEMNKRIWKNNKYRNIWFMGMQIMIPDEATLFTNKLVALSDRKNPVARDLFDIWFFLSKGFQIHEELIRERTGKTKIEYLEYVSALIRKTYTKRNILQGLGDALDERRKSWARDNLIDETIKLIEQQILH